MGRSRYDDIMNDLGLHGDGNTAPQPKRGSTPAKPGQGDAISPLPSAPGGQHSFGDASTQPPNSARGPLSNQDPSNPAAIGAALSELFHPGSAAPVSNDLGEYLVSKGVLTHDKLTNAQNVLKGTPGKRLAEALIELGIDEAAVQAGVAEIAGLSFERIDLNKGLDGGFDGKMLQRLGPDFCKENLVVPLRTEGSRVVIGCTRADDVFIVDEVKRRLGVSGIKLAIITSFDVKGVMEIVGFGSQENLDVAELLSEVEEADVQVEKKQQEEVDLEREAQGSPVIRYVNHIIQAAVKEGASDIHIEPSEKKLKVRFRIDGELYEMMNPPAAMAAAIVSRLKIMANLDISERRLPQDGRIRCVVAGRKLDLRMSTIPTAGSTEKVVMRILDTRSINVELDQLGFDVDTLTIWKNQIESPHGIILVTGPTGSGKTTTLYASLRQLDKTSMNISTVEDPVEYHLDGITQTQTHDKIGMTFALALKALLRQDPDVIMLGEIRDMETASTAIQAALTGHLVLSTLHTNDAPSSITRLVNIGLEPFLVGAAVNAVLAQRLVRRLCKECKFQEAPSEDMLEYLTMQGMPTDATWAAKGCDKCRKLGYAGRVGLYELLTIDDGVRDIVARNPNVAEFRRICIERGMVTLRNDGLRKAQMGMTTIQEILRVTEGNS
ncbi:MAG: GspE/PulE family protein [Planctomycetes bacterium]|nr:GspE/PulE family protein [Planctomycetota bacterium]